MHYLLAMVTVGEVSENDIEILLEPFQEDTVNSDYLEWLDCTEEVEIGWNTDIINTQHRYKSIAQYAEKNYGYTKGENGTYGYERNPNGHWDWWVVGGRWDNFLKVKKCGEFGNQVLLSKIDFDAMSPVDCFSPYALLLENKWVNLDTSDMVSLRAQMALVSKDPWITIVDCHT